MKKYIDQIFYEGLGYSLYVPIEKLISKINNKKLSKINNKKLSKILINMYKTLYFIFSIAIAIFILYVKLS